MRYRTRRYTAPRARCVHSCVPQERISRQLFVGTLPATNLNTFFGRSPTESPEQRRQAVMERMQRMSHKIRNRLGLSVFFLHSICEVPICIFVLPPASCLILTERVPAHCRLWQMRSLGLPQFFVHPNSDLIKKCAFGIFLIPPFA